MKNLQYFTFNNFTKNYMIENDNRVTFMKSKKVWIGESKPTSQSQEAEEK